MPKINYIKIAKKSAGIQIRELKKINKVFNKDFIRAVETIHKARGRQIRIDSKKSKCFPFFGRHKFFFS